MKTIADIQAIRESMQPAMFIRDNSDEHLETRIVVGMGTCGISKGAKFVFDALVGYIAATARVFAITNLPSKFTFPENPRSFTER